jgi:hypothetical protein
MAEGIKISDMEQVSTLEDGCCFPVVSNGENKKITQKNLYKLMTSKLYSDKANFYNTSMVNLGFEKDSYVSIHDFWNAIVLKLGINGLVRFSWDDSKRAYLGTSNNNILINGGTLIYTASGSPSSWQNFNAIYIGVDGFIYNINLAYADDLYIITSKINKLANNNDIDTLDAKLKNTSLKTDKAELDIASLQEQITSNDNDITWLSNQINSIKKPDGIEIFRVGVNIPESNFTEQSSGAGTPPKEYKYTLPKTNARLIDYKLTSECGCKDNENGTVTIYMPASISGANRICKGYIEYVEV